MKVKMDAARLGQSKWYEYAMRFAFGGSITAVAGVFAKRFGPEIGGLFLAFPAILPATASLISKHEKEKKKLVGKHGSIRGRKTAGADAAGAAMGGIWLVVFAIVVWKRLPQSSLWLVLCEATLAWFVTSVTIWFMRDKLWRRFVQRLRASHAPGSTMGGDAASINRRGR
jgi:hypothetical protein